jgi:hypothetical protein
MSFLNPLLLAGMGAIAIPIVIHLLNKRHPERVVWGAMRFLQTSVEQNRRRLQIEELLLLVLRCLLIALLALALARPALKGSSSGTMFGQDRVTGVFILDNSYSMSQTNGVTSRFDRAKQALQQAMDALPSGSAVAVVLGSDIADAVIPTPTYNLALARKALANAKICDRGTNLLQPLKAAINVLKQTAGYSKEIFLATDGQALGFQQLDDIESLLDADKDDERAHLLLTGDAETQNLGVSDLKMGADIPAVGVLQPFQVQVTNWGAQRADHVRVTLSVDADAPSVEATIDQIPDGQARTITLAVKMRDDGYHTVTAAVPPDHLPADDTRTFALRGVANVEVLLVDGTPGREARDSEVFFLSQALVPVARALASSYFIHCTTIAPTELAGKSLTDYPIVVLADVADLDVMTLDNLQAYVQHGGALMIFPGSHSRPSLYNDGLLTKRGIMPGELGSTDGNADQRVKFFHLSAGGLEHPIVSVFGNANSGNLADAHFYERYLINPVSSASVRTILRFSDGQPYLLERSVGAGRVFLFASTASTRWNDLPDHAGLWVPLLYRTVGWIVSQKDQLLNVKVGEPFVFHPALEDLGKQAEITPPGDSGAAVPDTRQIEMDAANEPTVVYDQTNLAGTYTLSIPGRAPVKFAVQADPEESNLTPITDAQRAQLAQYMDVKDFRDGTNLSESLTRSRVGKELWLPLAIVALLLAAGEMVLADWFSLPK